jgi:hypothetical protein
MKKLIVILFILLLTSVCYSKDIESQREQLKIETKLKIEAQRARMLERKREHKIEIEIEYQKVINYYRNSQRRNYSYNRNYYRQRRIYPVRNRRYGNRNRIVIVYFVGR